MRPAANNLAAGLIRAKMSWFQRANVTREWVARPTNGLAT